MQVQPYLNFNGRCEEAINFYKSAVGAEVTMLMRFKDNPAPPPPGCSPAGSENKVMHASLLIGDATVMASDCMCEGQPEFKGISLALTADSDAKAERAFAALGDGGKVNQAMAKTFFSSRFGVVTDRFGVTWMVLVKNG